MAHQLSATNPWISEAGRSGIGLGTNFPVASDSIFTIGDAPAAAAGATPAVPESTRRLGGLATRPPPDRDAAMRLLLRALVVAWALLVFVLACVAVARLGGAPRPSAECDDNNACTRDLAVDGGCLRLPLADDLPCSGDAAAVCYGGDAGASAGKTPTCRAGACVGAACAGVCTRTADCPTIMLRGQPRHATCQWSICVYLEQAQMPVASSQCSNEVFDRFCTSLLTPTDPYRRCLTTSAMCDAGQLSCLYTFACAVPVPA